MHADQFGQLGAGSSLFASTSSIVLVGLARVMSFSHIIAFSMKLLLSLMS